MFCSNSTSSEASDPSVGIQYEMEDESQENKNCESTDFVCSDTGGDSNIDTSTLILQTCLLSKLFYTTSYKTICTTFV